MLDRQLPTLGSGTSNLWGGGEHGVIQSASDDECTASQQMPVQAFLDFTRTSPHACFACSRRSARKTFVLTRIDDSSCNEDAAHEQDQPDHQEHKPKYDCTA
jgi:hypothetical protein